MKYSRNRRNNGYIGCPDQPHPYGAYGINKLHFLETKINTPTDFSVERDVLYKRPSDWLAMPDMTSGDQRIAILLDIVKGASGNTGATADSNFIAFGISGAYIVDWGNGITQAFASGATATYQYNFDSVSGGTSTENNIGNRQVIIQVYPQSGSQFDIIDFNRRYPLPWRPAIATMEYIKDIKIAGSTIRSVRFGANVNSQVSMSFLQKLEFVGETGITNADGFIYYTSTALHTVKGREWSKNVGNWNFAFAGSVFLHDITELDMRSTGLSFQNIFIQFVTPLANTFQQNFSLRYVPAFDWRQANGCYQTFWTCPRLRFFEGRIKVGWAEVATQLFTNCYSLRDYPGWEGTPLLGDTLSATGATTTDAQKRTFPAMAQMFEQCSGLSRIKDLNISRVRQFNSMFNGCASLIYAPPMDTRYLITTSSTFANSGVQFLPPYDLVSCGELSSMFSGCLALHQYPTTLKLPSGTGPQIPFQAGAAIKYNSMFNNCYNMSIPAGFRLLTISGDNFSSMFQNCHALRETPSMDLSAGLDFSNMFATCVSIRNFSNANSYNTTRGQNFNGMFVICTGMTTAPSFSVASGVTFNGMYSQCRSLLIPPSMSGWGGTGMTVNANGLFSNCLSLGKDPAAYPILAAYDFSKVKNANGMFAECISMEKIPSENWDTSGVLNFSTFAESLNTQGKPSGLEIIPRLDVRGVTANANLESIIGFTRFSSLGYWSSIKVLGLTGTRASVNLRNAMLSATQLNDIFQGLSAGRGGLTPGTIRTITINNNPGAAACDRTIATNKGWQVLG